MRKSYSIFSQGTADKELESDLVEPRGMVNRKYLKKITRYDGRSLFGG